MKPVAEGPPATQLGFVDAPRLLWRLAGAQSVPVRVRTPNTLPFRADARLLEEALLALLDDAVRCGAPPFELRAGLTPEGCVRLEVADGGPERSAPAVLAAVAAAHDGSAGLEARTGGGVIAWIAVPSVRTQRD